MKICHVTSAHDTDDVRIFYKECTSLAKKPEYEVYLVGHGSSRKENGVSVIGVGEMPNNRLKRMSMFSKKVVKTAMSLNADIYHFHDPELIRYALKIKKKGFKVVFDSHENVLSSIDEKTYIPLFVRKVMKLYFRVLQKRVFPNIDGLIVVSPQMSDSYLVYNKNVFLIANYPIIRDEQFVQAKTIPGRIVFAGGITKQWSHKEIIQAIENIDGVQYRLFGAGDNDYIEELKQLKGWKKVYYGGKISFEEVQAEISLAQVCVALLKPGNNTFGEEGTLGNTKLFEAMENGKPLLATNFYLWKKIVEEGGCGLCVNPDKINDIRKAIISLLSNINKTEEMGVKGRSLVINRYNWEENEQVLFQLYKILDRNE